MKWYSFIEVGESGAMGVESGAMGEDTSPIVIKDGRLAARILINQQLRMLINTVIDALEVSNPTKLQELLKVGNDSGLLKKMIVRKKSVEFMESLYNNPLITK